MTIADPYANGCHAAATAGPIPELPSPDTKRWVVRRKAVVVQAVRNGMISLQEACRRYNLSVEEFVAWQQAIERHGIPGLRVTRLQIYRDTEEPRSANRLPPRGTIYLPRTNRFRLRADRAHRLTMAPDGAACNGGAVRQAARVS